MSLVRDVSVASSINQSDSDSLLSYTEEKSSLYTDTVPKTNTSEQGSVANTHGSTLVPDSPKYQNAAMAYANESVPLSPNQNQNKDDPFTLRRIAIDLSLYLNLIIMFSKLYAYIQTLSLSVLAALTDSLLDVVSQLVLNYTERRSSKSRSSALYPAGAARLEPLGILTCAALMGMASFEIMRESLESLAIHGSVMDMGDMSEQSTFPGGIIGFRLTYTQMNDC